MNIIGHEEKWEMLSTLISEDRLSHALLFEGIEGIGKKEIAIKLANEILCKTDRDRHQMMKNTFPDFLMIGQESAIKVDDINRVIHFMTEKPVYSDKKIVIIDDAHKMNRQSQNKFLKSLEEAPSFCHVFLITSQKGKLLDTILSRVYVVNFEPLSKEHLKLVLPKQSDQKAYEAALSFSGGSVLKAMDILENESRRNLFFAPKDIFEYLLQDDILKVSQVIELVTKQKEDMSLVFDHLEMWLRDLSIIRENQASELILYAMFRKELIEQRNSIRSNRVTSLLERLDRARQQVEFNVNPSIVLYAMIQDWQKELAK